MNCNSSTTSLCIALLLLISSIITGILYLIYIDIGDIDNKFGEVSLYLFAISFLACIIRTSIRDETKNPSSTKITPV